MISTYRSSFPMSTADVWQQTYQILLVLNFAVSTTFHENRYIKDTQNQVISLTNESYFLGFLKCILMYFKRYLFFFILVYYIITNVSRGPPQLSEMQSFKTAFANNQNKYKTTEQYHIHIFVTIISYRVLRRGEKHA